MRMTATRMQHNVCECSTKQRMKSTPHVMSEARMQVHASAMTLNVKQIMQRVCTYVETSCTRDTYVEVHHHDRVSPASRKQEHVTYVKRMSIKYV